MHDSIYTLGETLFQELLDSPSILQSKQSVRMYVCTVCMHIDILYVRTYHYLTMHIRTCMFIGTHVRV